MFRKFTLFDGILVAAFLTMLFLQIKSCSDGSPDVIKTLQHDRDSLKKANDASNIKINLMHANESVFRLMYSADSAFKKSQIDSLTKLANQYKQKASSLELRLNKTIADLRDAVLSGDTSASIAGLEDLKRQFADYINQTHFENDVVQAKESIYTAQISEQDSVIRAKNQLIDSLFSLLRQKEDIVSKLMNDLDIAIAQLKKGKKANILRTIGEAVLVVALIFKK